MNANLESSAPKIREVAMEFLKINEKKQFRRKELEDYVDSKLEVTEGAKNGALNRVLKDNEKEGVFRVDRGLYLYDSTAKKEDYELLKGIQNILDDAFAEVKNTVSNLEIVDYLTEYDLSSLAKIHELLKMQQRIHEILDIKE
ncbi:MULTISPECIES: hypothetical protein [Bacillus cereus group]|uniref:hypothetical protein n=1 Tax=Bacillus cereus group TaxID=86661 RepID=UPI0009923C2A|nr:MULTISPECIES: hypothetical protein [Bacillus cereus group]OOR18180.1 hypothetical protein BW891_14580 [Bacillus mycoides]QWG81331.1 hypothetical protein EXW27_27935 [Bacillus mycoides]TXR90680.1 hypothetical protein DN408_01215 [Bacillus sp. AR13-1]